MASARTATEQNNKCIHPQAQRKRSKSRVNSVELHMFPRPAFTAHHPGSIGQGFLNRRSHPDNELHRTLDGMADEINGTGGARMDPEEVKVCSRCFIISVVLEIISVKEGGGGVAVMLLKYTILFL